MASEKLSKRLHVSIIREVRGTHVCLKDSDNGQSIIDDVATLEQALKEARAERDALKIELAGVYASLRDHQGALKTRNTELAQALDELNRASS